MVYCKQNTPQASLNVRISIQSNLTRDVKERFGKHDSQEEFYSAQFFRIKLVKSLGNDFQQIEKSRGVNN